MNTVLASAANDPATPTLALPGKALPASAGLSWLGEGWALFRKSPLMWVVLTILVLVAAFLFALIPFLGPFLWQILTPVIGGGLVLGSWALDEGGELELEHLFAGFKRNFAGLALVGLFYAIGVIVLLMIFAVFVGLSILPALMSGDSAAAYAAMAAVGGGLLAGTLVVTVLSIALGASMWFAPALVVMHNVAPLAAMKTSLFAVFRNFLPALIYAVVMFLLAVLAAIPFGLGMLVWVPVLATSSYRAYRQIFTE